MCSIPHSIRQFMCPTFPPLEERAKRWIESELTEPETLADHWLDDLTDLVDEEQKPC